LSISKRIQREYKIRPPSKKTVESSWGEWFDEELPKLSAAVSAVTKKTSPNDVKGMREVKILQKLLGEMRMMKEELAEDNAVYDGYESGDIKFLPITVAKRAKNLLWRHSPPWMLMSATFIDPTEFVETMGIEEAGLTWAVVKVPSTFDPANRPIHIRGLARMTNKDKEEEWPKMVEGIKQVLAKHPNDRTLIHTVSYPLAKYLAERLKSCGRPILEYSNANERDTILNTFRNTPAAVLLAPSMDRGVDLPEDDCRVVIVAKIPFPYLGDKRTNKRLYSTKGGQLWYAVQTIRSLVQMTGRGVRSESDQCDIYILDKTFMSNVWKDSKRLLPDWWKDSLDFSGGGIR
jgi:ATP-dependent DNA helicase DinG